MMLQELHQLFKIKLLEAENNTGKFNSRVDKAVSAIQTGKAIYIWPYAQVGKEIYKRLTKEGYTNIFRLDIQANHAEGIYTPDEIMTGRTTDGVLIISSLVYVQNIYYKAKEMGFLSVVMYYEIVEPLGIDQQAFPDNFHIETIRGLSRHLLSEKDKYMNMYHHLEDDSSRICFLNNMLFRLTGDVSYIFDKDETVEQYFNELTTPFVQEMVFIDGGGFIGDTLEHFLRCSKNTFQSYYLFEPDPVCFTRAQKVTNDTRVRYIQKGLYSEPRIFFFESSGGTPGGFVSEHGNMKIELTSIDHEVDEKVDFIKMDIEGAEREALRGASQTIITYKPKLAICLYHKYDDFTEVFDLVYSMNENYKFYIRHHQNNFAETVLYAI
ncbi:FkbM family methyltransferase [Synergistaceae bacterium OttesenSCG-928-I11]|nr:FkbM family methyltransferase [Synergistaceae bacterium OttesenSCG-928-I11]